MYDVRLKHAGSVNSRPYFTSEKVVKLRWSYWNGLAAWIIVGGIVPNETPRFLSWSNVGHPKDASNWYYLPYASDTANEDMVNATNLSIFGE